MNPEQAPPHNVGQYDFIVNPGKAPKPSKSLLGGGDSTKSFILKIALIVGAVVIFMIVVAVIMNLLFGTKTNTDDIVKLAQTQTEVSRIAAFGSSAGDQAVKNVAASSQQVVTSQRQAMLSYLQKHGRKVKDKELNLKKNSATDNQLALALQASTYNTVFRQVLTQQLEAYATQLKSAYDNSSDKLARSLLSKDYTEVQTLIKQANAP